MNEGMQAYEARKSALMQSLRDHGSAGLRLRKETSNLFRDRRPHPGPRLDVREFQHVLGVDPGAGVIEVEGMTPYVDLVDACLREGVMPPVVPQLKWITVGGAVSGVGIESSAFRYGLVHETVREMDVLLADGTVVTCGPAGPHADLFFGLPNSYGTLGYVLKLRLDAVPVEPFVQLTHIRHRDAAAFFADLTRWCAAPVDFVDGVIFGPDELYLSIGRFVSRAPYTSDYQFEHIYYRSIRARTEDYLRTRDYLWRWDTDWFWCSKNLLAQHPLVRRLYGRNRLNSKTYARLMRWNARWGLSRRLERLLGYHSESVIQDVDIPVDRAREFLDFYFREIRFTPVWVCPFRALDPEVRYPLYPTRADTLYVNFGFWDVIRYRGELPRGHYNRLVEQAVAALDGIKSLYSDSYYEEEEFWRHYDRAAYRALKARYDAGGRLADLYDKCVRKA